MNNLVLLSSLTFLPFTESVANSSGYLLDRRRRDYDHGDYHVKCKSSNTGKSLVINDVIFILYPLVSLFSITLGYSINTLQYHLPIPSMDGPNLIQTEIMFKPIHAKYS